MNDSNYIPEDHIERDELLQAEVASGQLEAWNTDGDGRKWYRRKHPLIFCTPQPVRVHGPRQDELIEGGTDADIESEMRAYAADAIARLHERVEEIRIAGWNRDWTPDADDEGGYSDD